MADKNLMTAISGLADAKADPEKVKAAESKKKPKVVNLGKGGSFNVKPHPHRNLGKYLHPKK
ncbi:MAG TPA: hypothetical protein VHW72_02800 [Candidatus Angelobacter sp.]|jgi:hypothetical protein|nr:hypothetical protein [Candidatus Angelobacter sp.]